MERKKERKNELRTSTSPFLSHPFKPQHPGGYWGVGYTPNPYQEDIPNPNTYICKVMLLA